MWGTTVHKELWSETIINHPELGQVHTRSVAIVRNGKISTVVSEESAECVVTSGRWVLELLAEKEKMCIKVVPPVQQLSGAKPA